MKSSRKKIRKIFKILKSDSAFVTDERVGRRLWREHFKNLTSIMKR